MNGKFVSRRVAKQRLTRMYLRGSNLEALDSEFFDDYMTLKIHYNMYDNCPLLH